MTETPRIGRFDLQQLIALEDSARQVNLCVGGAPELEEALQLLANDPVYLKAKADLTGTSVRPEYDVTAEAVRALIEISSKMLHVSEAAGRESTVEYNLSRLNNSDDLKSAVGLAYGRPERACSTDATINCKPRGSDASI